MQAQAQTVNRTDIQEREYTEEQGLIAAMLQGAIDEAHGVCKSDTTPCRDCFLGSNVKLTVTDLASLHTVQECAIEWLKSDDPTPWLFIWACEELELEPSYVRRLAGV
jgi:hypothetical protein